MLRVRVVVEERHDCINGVSVKADGGRRVSDLPSRDASLEVVRVGGW